MKILTVVPFCRQLKIILLHFEKLYAMKKIEYEKIKLALSKPKNPKIVESALFFWCMYCIYIWIYILFYSMMTMVSERINCTTKHLYRNKELFLLPFSFNVFVLVLVLFVYDFSSFSSYIRLVCAVSKKTFAKV